MPARPKYRRESERRPLSGLWRDGFFGKVCLSYSTTVTVTSDTIVTVGTQTKVD